MSKENIHYYTIAGISGIALGLILCNQFTKDKNKYNIDDEYKEKYNALEYYDHSNQQQQSSTFVTKSLGALLRDFPAVVEESKKFAAARPFTAPGITLPTNLDGRIIWKGYLPDIMNQGICGGCAMYALSYVLAARFAIMTLGQIKFQPSPASVLLCANLFTDIQSQWGDIKQLELMDDYLHGAKVDPNNTLQTSACEGTSLYTVMNIAYQTGITTINCFPIQGEVNGIKYNIPATDPEKSSSLPYCYKLAGLDLDTCIDGKTAMRRYRASTVYNIGDPNKDSDDQLEKDLMTELYKYGPVQVGMMVFSDFMNWDGKGIYTGPSSGSTQAGGHSVALVGYGTDNGIDYWIIANSWGPTWGEQGYCKIKRKIKQLQLERNAVAMLPDFAGFAISDPNIVPVQTEQWDLSRNYAGHYMDINTGYYLSAIDKVENCQLNSDGGTNITNDENQFKKVYPYFSQSSSLPNYNNNFYAGTITAPVLQLPSTNVAQCKTLSTQTTTSSTQPKSGLVVNPSGYIPPASDNNQPTTQNVTTQNNNQPSTIIPEHHNYPPERCHNDNIDMATGNKILTNFAIYVIVIPILVAFGFIIASMILKFKNRK
jgi:hypothetical protein